MRRWTDNIDPETRAAFAALVRLAWPVVLTRLATQLMALIDTMVVGQYDSRQLAFSSLGIGLSWVPAVTGMGLLMGVQVKTSHFLGAQDHHRIGAVFQRGVRYALLLGLGCFGLLWLTGPFLLRVMTRPDLAAGATAPLGLFALSLPMFLITIACSNFLEALGRPRDVLIATLAANGLNAILLFVLVPAHIQIFGLTINGATGAATATLIARTALCLGLFVYVVTMPATRDFGLLTRQAADVEGAREQRHVGYARRGGLLYRGRRLHRHDPVCRARRLDGGGRLGYRPQLCQRCLHGAVGCRDGLFGAGRPCLWRR